MMLLILQIIMVANTDYCCDNINLLIISICWVYFNFSSSSSIPKLHDDVINAPPLGLWQVDEQVDPQQGSTHNEHNCAIGIEKCLWR